LSYCSGSEIVIAVLVTDLDLRLLATNLYHSGRRLPNNDIEQATAPEDEVAAQETEGEKEEEEEERGEENQPYSSLLKAFADFPVLWEKPFYHNYHALGFWMIEPGTTTKPFVFESTNKVGGAKLELDDRKLGGSLVGDCWRELRGA
jgi:hypothetical protein